MRYAAHLVAAVVVVVASADGFAQVQNSRGYLGLMLDDRQWNIGGVPVMRVHPRTPADVAGFQVGDVVISCNGSPVRQLADFARAIYQVPVGGRAVMEVQRGRELFELTAVLSTDPNFPLENFRPPVAPDRYDTADISTNRLRDGRPMLGLVVGTIQTRSYGAYGSLRQWGVVVEDIVPGSPAEQHRVPRGAVLTSINGLAIRAPEDVFAIMEQVPVDRPVELAYVYGGSAYRQVVPLTPPDATPRDVGKPLDEGIVIESPREPTPAAPTPAIEPRDEVLPELPPPDPAPEDDVRLPARVVPTPEQVRAMRSELDTLRRRAAEIETEINALKRDGR